MELFEVSVPSEILSEIPDKCFSYYFNNLTSYFNDNRSLKSSLKLFHTLLEISACTRSELYKNLFCSDKQLSTSEKINCSRMLYIENLRRKRYIHKFYRDEIDKYSKVNNEFIEWIDKEIDEVEKFVTWPDEETES